MGAILVVSLVAATSDLRRVGAALKEFDWRLIAPIILLTLWNYGWRFMKWQRYLKQLGEHHVPLRVSIVVFVSAFSMSVTPGKIGELIKASELRRICGTPMSRTTAIIAAERLTDALAMLILASTGALLFDQGRLLLLAAAVFAVTGVYVLRHPRPLLAVLGRLPPLPVIGRTLDHSVSFFTTSGRLMSARNLAAATSIGIVAWLGECAALYVVLLGLGLPSSRHLFVVAVFTLAVSSLAGALSLLPGGLGVAEASAAGILLLLISDERMTASVATAATVIIRFATLWFAVGLGLAALWLAKRMSPVQRAEP